VWCALQRNSDAMKELQNTVTKFSKEAQLLEPVAKFAKSKGYGLQLAELPFYEYRIDLYGFSHRKDATVAIELKLTDWRRALIQSLLYQLCADLVYIAMPRNSALRVDRAALKAEGVGLLAVNDAGSCSCLLAAQSHDEVRPPYRLSQINYLKGMTCV
jgi:hypothetical protein